MKMPTFDQLMLPTLKALESLGGSGSIEEIATTVIQALNLPTTSPLLLIFRKILFHYMQHFCP